MCSRSSAVFRAILSRCLVQCWRTPFASATLRLATYTAGTARLCWTSSKLIQGLLAPLLDIPLPPERAVSLPPEELRRRQLAPLIHLVIAGARAQPAVLTREDLHWADPTTLDLVRGIAERVRRRPCSSSSPLGPNFGRRGVCARITAQSP